MQIKTIQDYYSEVYDKFPELDQKDIERILNFGFNSLYLHLVYGGDILIKDDSVNKYTCYIGKLTYKSLKHLKYYAKKLTTKLRVFYNRNKTEWDGFYYFALTENQYIEYLNQIKSKGRKRKYFKFNNILLYKLYKECKVKEYSKKYIFKYATGTDLGYLYWKKELITDKVEFIEELNDSGMNRLMKINNEARNN